MKNSIPKLNTIVLVSFLASVAFAESTLPTKFGKPLQAITDKAVSTASVFDTVTAKKLPNSAAEKLQKSDFKSVLMGGVNGGGGNSINHKMIDAYGKAITDFPEYKGTILKVLNELKAAMPTLHDTLKQKMNEITWYIIPAEIAELPRDVTGLPFESDQTAIQLQNEVFINQSQFEAMNPEERLYLFIHETVLGLHIQTVQEENKNWEKSFPPGTRVEPYRKVDPRAVRQITIGIIGKTYAEEPLVFLQLVWNKIPGPFLNNEEIAEGKELAKKALNEMSTACLELGKKSDEEMMIKIGEILFFHNRNSSENAYRKCVEMTPDQCDMTVMLGHQAFGRGLKAVSSMWSSNKEPFGGKPYAHFTTNNPQLMCAIVNETLKNL